MRYLLFIVAIVILQSCGTTQQGMKGVNLAYMYQVDGQVVRAKFALQRVSNDSAEVYFSFHTNDLLFMRDREEGELFASVSFAYRLYKHIDDKMPVDTGTVNLNRISQSNKQVIGHFPVSMHHLERNDEGVLVIITRDLHRNFKMTSFVKVQNTHSDQAQNWQASNGQRILLSPYVTVGDTLQFRHRQDQSGRYAVSHFRDRFTLALPPFSEKKTIDRDGLVPDSTFLINATEPVVFRRPGVYHVRRDAGTTRGLTIYVREGHYPYITRKSELVGPMRYITTKREYEALVENDDPAAIKKAVDRFWLERTRSVSRSQDLVAAFYGRVEKANLLFSSYKEGWMTDRGLIFTIFGPPNIVSTTKDGERWVYGEENAYLSYVFDFVRMDNPLSENDFELVRNEAYRYGWGLAIEAWRLGKVYNVKDIKREQDERDQEIRFRQQPYFWY